MKPVAFLVLIGALVILAIGYSYTRIQSDLFTARKDLNAANVDNEKLRAKLVSEDTELDSLRKQITAYESKIQSLNGEAKLEAQTQSTELQALETALANQRQLTDQKRRDYQAMLTGKVGSGDQGAIRKTLNDEIATIRQRLGSLKDEIARTRDDGMRAREARKSDANFGDAQEKSRMDAANQQLAILKKQRATLNSQRGNPLKIQQLQEMDEQIGVAQTTVNQLRDEQNRQRGQEHADASTLEAQIRQTMDGLNEEQRKLQAQLQTKQNQALKLDGASAASGEFQKERAELIKKMAAQLQDETDKLQKLEAQVAAAKTRTR